MIVKVLIPAFAIFAIVAGDDSELRTEPADISQQCLGCICEAASDCNATIGCRGDVCGPFKITWGYWADSGKPTLNGQPDTEPNAWTNCVNNALCAADAVRVYMGKYGKDCNGDGKIDCDDFARIHFLGAYGCSGNFPLEFEDKYKTCRKAFSN